MAAELSFKELIERVRHGDEPAADELLRRYEPAMRRVIQVRLFDSRIRRVHDADDICQSVLASFFVRLALGQYEFDTPEDLIKLLGSMARNKIADKGRRAELEGPIDQRLHLSEIAEGAAKATDGTPSQNIAIRELITEARRRLNPEDRRLLELREAGLEWIDIAQQVGGSPEALRKRLARAGALVAQQLGLVEDEHE
jgi:RNA polymerase sigma factor (sigma-70 family)